LTAAVQTMTMWPMILLHHITCPLTRKNHNRHEVLTTVSQL